MSIPSVDIAQYAAALRAGASTVDVREDDEVAAARLDGAIHIALGDIPRRWGEVPAGPVYVLCARGSRSARAVQYLRGKGIDAVNVDGGIVAWLEAGLPVESDEG
jgi:rhodanese-related sulfurtransferase